MKAVKKIFSYKESTLFVIIILLMALITLRNPVFLTFGNMIDILRSGVVLGIAALGVLVVINTGGIDVSVGALIAMVTVVIAHYMLSFAEFFTGLPNIIFITSVFLVGLVTGAILGTINGLFVAKLKIPAIVVTLATMSIVNGALRWYTNGAWITGLPTEFVDIGRIVFFGRPNENDVMIGVPIQVPFLIFAAILTALMLRYTIVGRGIMAMGGNKISSARIGFSNDRLTIFAFMYSGLMCGLAGVVYTTIMRTVDSNAFIGYELRVIGAVVIGGASIKGGSGTVLGTMLGMFLMVVVNNGLVITHISTFYQDIIIGAIILFAVCFDVIKTKRAEQKMAQVDIEEDAVSVS